MVVCIGTYYTFKKFSLQNEYIFMYLKCIMASISTYLLVFKLNDDVQNWAVNNKS